MHRHYNARQRKAFNVFRIEFELFFISLDHCRLSTKLIELHTDFYQNMSKWINPLSLLIQIHELNDRTPDSYFRML